MGEHPILPLLRNGTPSFPVQGKDYLANARKAATTWA